MGTRQTHPGNYKGRAYQVITDQDLDGKYHFIRWQLDGLPATAVVGDRPYPLEADAVATAKTFVEHRIDLIIAGNQAEDAQADPSP